ncbi:hypothetical protein [Methanobrevibacter sp.]
MIILLIVYLTDKKSKHTITVSTSNNLNTSIILHEAVKSIEIIIGIAAFL